MTAPLVLQWVVDHWPQIAATISALLYFAMTLAVGAKDHPLPGETRLSFAWRVGGRAAFATFRNIYGTWKIPGFKQKVDLVVLDSVPEPVPGENTDKKWPAPAERGPGSPQGGDGSGGMPQAGAGSESGSQSPPGVPG